MLIKSPIFNIVSVLYFIFRLPISVGAMYVRHYFKQGSKKAAVELVNRIRAQFEIILAENHWMDANTKAAALNKLEAIYTHIGYPDELMDNRKLEQLYSGWEIDPDKYFESMLRMNVFVTDYSLNKLRKPVNKTDWVTRISSATVNAGYSSMENSIRMYSNSNSHFQYNNSCDNFDKLTLFPNHNNNMRIILGRNLYSVLRQFLV